MYAFTVFSPSSECWNASFASCLSLCFGHPHKVDFRATLRNAPYLNLVDKCTRLVQCEPAPWVAWAASSKNAYLLLRVCTAPEPEKGSLSGTLIQRVRTSQAASLLNASQPPLACHCLQQYSRGGLPAKRCMDEASTLPQQGQTLTPYYIMSPRTRADRAMAGRGKSQRR